MKTTYLHNGKPIAKIEHGLLELLDCDMLFLGGATTIDADGPNDLQITTVSELHNSFSRQAFIRPNDKLTPHEQISEEEKRQRFKHMF